MEDKLGCLHVDDDPQDQEHQSLIVSISRPREPPRPYPSPHSCDFCRKHFALDFDWEGHVSRISESIKKWVEDERFG